MISVLVLHHDHHQTCDATNSKNKTCPSSSCGKISNIKYPFRLKNDPTTCGDPRYELSCENNKTTLTLSSSKYYVKSINYNNYTIRLVDPGIQESDCSSMPRYFLTTSNFTSSYDYNYRGDPYETFQDRIPSGTLPLFDHVVYMNCSNLVRDDHAYTDTASCIKLNSQGGHVYAIAGDLTVGNLKHNDCHVMVVTAISFFGYNHSKIEADNFYQKFSYSEIHRMLVDGFEVSWLSGPCQDLCGNPGDCSLRETTLTPKCSGRGDYCITTMGFHVDCGTTSKLRMFVEGDTKDIEIPPKPSPYPTEIIQDHVTSSSESVSDDDATGSISFLEETIEVPLL
ncbi:hypothetical protein P8452_00850 [Trifolium repens]|nr:hypothetical protein P8452_00850 [Trifolium repens]